MSAGTVAFQDGVVGQVGAGVRRAAICTELKQISFSYLSGKKVQF